MIIFFLPLIVLLLSGCFDSGCCKKHNRAKIKSQTAHVNTPKKHCCHAGCTHDHNQEKSTPKDHEIPSQNDQNKKQDN